MNPHGPDSPPALSRRRFFETLAQGSVIAGAAAVGATPLAAAPANPFAYDVSRYAKTDPALIGWVETGCRVCPGKGARRLAVGPDDTVHAAAEGEVVRLHADGRTSRFETGGAVTAVAVAPDGTVYAALRNHIEVFASDGKRVAAWEVPDRRTWISSLALVEGGLLAADAGGRVILRYDRTGRVVARIGAKDAARQNPGLIVPSPNLDVKLHPDGLLRVNNPGRHRYEAYTLDGDFAGAWGTASLAVQGFCGCCNPVGLAVLPDGRLVTCEKGLPRVKVFTADGRFESVVAGPETFAASLKAAADPGNSTRAGLDAVVDSRGHLHVLDRLTAEVRTFAPKPGARA
jgi:sugar lactone lactonase YvrE